MLGEAHGMAAYQVPDDASMVLRRRERHEEGRLRLVNTAPGHLASQVVSKPASTPAMSAPTPGCAGRVGAGRRGIPRQPRFGRGLRPFVLRGVLRERLGGIGRHGELLKIRAGFGRAGLGNGTWPRHPAVTRGERSSPGGSPRSIGPTRLPMSRPWEINWHTAAPLLVRSFRPIPFLCSR